MAIDFNFSQDITGYTLVGCAAFAAGALNAMAGGGSFLTFPALLGVHIPPVNANATSTVALWPGQIASLFAFRTEIRAGRNLLKPVIAAGCTGGVIGAWVLLHTAQSTFQAMVPWLLLFATVLFAISGPITKRLINIAPPHHDGPFPVGLFLSLVAVSFYIGYFGAGAGFLVISILSLFGVRSLNEMNALKVVCTSLANGIAVLTFIVAGAVFWKECLLMMGLATAGGYLGATYSRKMNPKILRGFVIGTGAALSAYYFYRR